MEQHTHLQSWTGELGNLQGYSVNRVFNVLLTGLFVLQAMASTEERAYEIMRELDVSYVLVIFGGLTGYSSDGTSQLSVESVQNLQHRGF